LGVGLSFLVLGTTITGYRLWGIGLVISITMLGITYGAKYANADARESFTPVDFIQYLSQGFPWPTTWPALANLAGIQKIEPPRKGVSFLVEFVRLAPIAELAAKHRLPAVYGDSPATFPSSSRPRSSWSSTQDGEGAGG